MGFFRRQEINGTSPLDLKYINDNFRNIFQKVFGNIEGADINSVNGASIIDGTLTADKIIVGSGEVSVGNVALGKTITGSSGFANPNYVNDGVTTAGGNYATFGTGNMSNNNTEQGYVQIDLGSSLRIAESKVFFYSGDNRSYWYKIKYSTDGTNWTYAIGNSDNNGWVTSPMSAGSTGVTYFPTVDKFSTPIVARYVRLYANGNTINNGNHIHEWELYCSSQSLINGGSIKPGTVIADTVRGNLLQGVRIQQIGFDQWSNQVVYADMTTNANGGILTITDSDGNLNASLGSESGSGPNRGGTLLLYDRSASKSRVQIGILSSDGGGICQVCDTNGNAKSKMDAGGFYGLGRRYMTYWYGTINNNTTVDITHNLGYNPLVICDGTTGNIGLTLFQPNINTTRIVNWNSGGNNWTGTVKFY